MELHCLCITALLVACTMTPATGFFEIDDDFMDEIKEDFIEPQVSILQNPRSVMESLRSGLWNSLFGNRKERHVDSNTEAVASTNGTEDRRQGKLLSPQAFNKISETLGALNTVGRMIVNITRGQEVSLNQPNPDKIDNVPEAILTLTKNVLGQNVTKTIEPLIKRVGMSETPSEELPVVQTPVIAPESAMPQKKKRMEEASTEVASLEDFSLPPEMFINDKELSIEGKEGENRCSTPAGGLGKCEDLSNCPSLLLDLTHLRESLCFKSLFVPGVCCPLGDVSAPAVTQKPLKLTTAAPAKPSLILKPTTKPTKAPTTTKRPPLVPVYTIDKEKPNRHDETAQEQPALGDNFVDSEDCGQQEYSSGRIVGGVEAPSGQWPWMAAIFLHGSKRTEFWCGGSLVGSKYVLTAAHCTRDSRQKPFAASQFTVRLGDIDLVSDNEDSAPITLKVKEVRAHPRFSRVGFYNDIAILVLDTKVRKNRFVIPICLPSPTFKKSRLPGKRATVVGWGTTYYGGKESHIQRQALLPIWRNEDCNRAYFQPITDNFLCAGYSEGGVDACQGDSGGGLFIEIDHRWTQIGIVSFGNKCGEPGYPGVYTRVTEYMDWVRENTKN